MPCHSMDTNRQNAALEHLKKGITTAQPSHTMLDLVVGGLRTRPAAGETCTEATPLDDGRGRLLFDRIMVISSS